jgi:hypothetical protein
MYNEYLPHQYICIQYLNVTANILQSHRFRAKYHNYLKAVDFFLYLQKQISTTDIHKLVRNDMDVNEHERLFNITLRHKLK